MQVAQLGGYVAEQTGYHHGEASLYDTIVRMAHDYPGSNNLPLLHGIGQFGTRLEGGKDAASPRYIFTLLHNHTRLLFPEADDSLLAREEEDGLLVEPTAYLPIIPMLLVNGSVGIGTGWSTDIPQYNPLDVIDTVAALLKEQAPTELTPWFAGYRGRIEMDGKRNQFTSEGKLQGELERACLVCAVLSCAVLCSREGESGAVWSWTRMMTMQKWMRTRTIRMMMMHGDHRHDVHAAADDDDDDNDADARWCGVLRQLLGSTRCR